MKFLETKNIIDRKVDLTASTDGGDIIRGLSSSSYALAASLEFKSEGGEGTVNDNVGVEHASVLGCNANNSNASARSLNANHAVSNSNDNYAGAFATKQCDSRNLPDVLIKSEYDREAMDVLDAVKLMELPQCDYGVPFMDNEGSDVAESNVNLSLLQELHVANSKRKLKNMRRFLVSREIVEMGVERCLSKASDSPQKREALKHREDIVNRIIYELETNTYHVEKPTSRTIKRRHKDGKDRNADIFSIYDRCVQNVVLIVIKEKFTNMITRNIYSGIEGRSVYSNNKTYCMLYQLRKFCSSHPNAYVMMTDIHHFYETARSEVVLKILSKTIKDRFLMGLLSDILMSLPHLPIGGTLSQLLSAVMLNECDREILIRFKPKIYCGFGDNRIYGDDDKQKLIEIRNFQRDFYHNKLGIEMKKDYKLAKVKDGFSFCRTIYKESYVKIRGELKRRTIRAALKGWTYYASYRGFLMKTDSKHLKKEIEKRLRWLKKRIKIVNA
jgi:hypothetical protein